MTISRPESILPMALDADLAAAIVKAQASVEVVEKRGRNDQLRGRSYATADDINATARDALSAAGAALMRVGHDLGPGKLEGFDLGAQAYAGDVVERWMLVHEGGGALLFETRTPVVVSKGRTHEKAVSASQTYNSGVVARGVLAMEREDEHAVDRRQDKPSTEAIRGRSQDRPRCSGPKSGHIAATIRRRAVAIAAVSGESADYVYADACRELGFLGGDGQPPAPEQLFVTDGLELSARLKAKLPAKLPGDAS